MKWLDQVIVAMDPVELDSIGLYSFQGRAEICGPSEGICMCGVHEYL